MANPPPLPPQARNNNRIIIVASVVLAIVVVGAIAAGSAVFFRQLRAKREALDNLKKISAQEQAKMADDIKSGKNNDSDSLGRMKDVLGKSAAQLGGDDGKAARAMASWLDKMQGVMRGYEAAAGKLREEKILSFNIRDRSTIEGQRKIVRDFLAANARFTETLKNSETLVRAELDAGGVPPRAAEATLTGYTRSQGTLRPLQMKIRQCDQTLGEGALAILDLLDQNWGRWERDEANGKLRFQDNDTLEKFNGFIRQIQTAGTEQGKAQQELIDKSRAITQQQLQTGAH